MLVEVDVTVVNVVKVEVVVRKVVVAVCATVGVCPTNKATTTSTADRLPKIGRIINLTLRYNLRSRRLKSPSAFGSYCEMTLEGKLGTPGS